MKKNWSKTIILKDNEFYNVFLDDKLLKSPEKKNFNFTDLKLAKFLKKEIDQQGDEINFKNTPEYNMAFDGYGKKGPLYKLILWNFDWRENVEGEINIKNSSSGSDSSRN